MPNKRLHLGWFMNFTTNEWNTPFGNDGMPWNGKFYIEMAKAMERACFDYIMIEDTLMVSEAYGPNSEVYSSTRPWRRNTTPHRSRRSWPRRHPNWV